MSSPDATSGSPSADPAAVETTPVAGRLGRDRDSWARPVDRLTTTASGAGLDTVTGRRVAGPLQGFGQLWQKTFQVRLEGVTASPEEVVAIWKDAFPTFWPSGNRFYAPLAGIAPGEVALLEIQTVPGAPLRMSTGVLVIYADRKSFTFMTPEGHALAAWITFSAFRKGDITVVQAQALERTSDPLIELSYVLGGNRMNDRFWEATLTNLARALGATAPVVETSTLCVDRRRQWRYARNVRHSPAISMAIGTMTAPARWLRRRTTRRNGGAL
jgi:hypothetical protein